MLSKCGKQTRDFWGAFILVSSNFLYFEGVFNKTSMLFALVGYENGYSQLGPTGLVGYLPSHIQRALMHGIIVTCFWHQIMVM